MKVDNPYMLATGGLLGMIVGGEVGEHMERTDDLHEIETARCKKFVTGNNKKGLACRENGQWVVVKLENWYVDSYRNSGVYSFTLRS